MREFVVHWLKKGEWGDENLYEFLSILGIRAKSLSEAKQKNPREWIVPGYGRMIFFGGDFINFKPEIRLVFLDDHEEIWQLNKREKKKNKPLIVRIH